MLSMVLDRKLAASDILVFVIGSYYSVVYPNLIALVQGPERIEKVRQEIDGQIYDWRNFGKNENSLEARQTTKTVDRDRIINQALFSNKNISREKEQNVAND